MASSGIFELVAGTVLHSDDVLVYVNVHDTTQSPQGTTLKLTSASLWANGQPITVAAGTVTVSTPVFQATETWNASGVTFTAIDVNVTNTASASGSLLVNLRVGGTSQFKVDKAGAVTCGALSAQAVTATTVTTGLAFCGIAGGAQSGTTPVASYGANYYNTGAARVRGDTGKAGLMWEFDATDSVYLQYITAGGTATAPVRITTAGAMTLASGLTVSAGGITVSAGLTSVQTFQAASLWIGATTNPVDVIASFSGDVVARFRNSSANPLGLSASFSAATPNDTAHQFYYASDATAQRFGVRSNGGIENYSANNVNLSDARTKKPGWTPLGYDFDRFERISVVRYQYKDQTHSDDNFGVIAQELEKVDPHFVDEFAFGPDKAMHKMVYEHDLFYAHMDITQQLQRRVKALEAQLAARN